MAQKIDYEDAISFEQVNEDEKKMNELVLFLAKLKWHPIQAIIMLATSYGWMVKDTFTGGGDDDYVEGLIIGTPNFIKQYDKDHEKSKYLKKG